MALGQILHLHTLTHTHTQTLHSDLGNMVSTALIQVLDQVKTIDTVIVNSTAKANPRCQMSHNNITTTTFKENTAIQEHVML